MSPVRSLSRLCLATGALFLSTFALASFALAAADDAAIAATIRTNLAKQLPNLPRIDEVTKSPVPGLWELRIGSQVIYSDPAGKFVIEGEIIDATKHVNLTKERVDRLTAFEFSKLPLKDAVVWKRGTGARKLVVFADPNCGYCKKLERDLNTVPDITVFTFLVPILGGDSPQKARDIWCSKDSGKAWRTWMIDGTAPPPASAKCDVAALSRNVALGEKHAVTGTPALVFEDSARVPGIISPEEIEKKFATLSRRKG
jgi:thiol:disulfide interchange protein DsbC